MDPITLGLLIGGGSSLLSSFFGASAQDKANDTNAQINRDNLTAAEKERAEAMAYAEMIRNEQKLGSTDARGNTVKWVPGQGWVTTLGRRDGALQDYYYHNEMPQERQKFQRDMERSRVTDRTANTLLNDFLRVQRMDPSEVEGLLLNNRQRGITQATNESMESAMRSAMRSGSSNADEIAAAISKQAMQQREAAVGDAKLQAVGMADDKFANDRANLGNLYQSFASMASNPVGASMSPNSIYAASSGLSGSTGSGDQAGMSAVGMQGGRSQMMPANTAWSDGIGAAGNAIAGGLYAYGANQQAQQNNQLLMSFLSGGQGFDLANGGMLGDISDRTRKTDYGF